MKQLINTDNTCTGPGSINLAILAYSWGLQGQLCRPHDRELKCNYVENFSLEFICVPKLRKKKSFKCNNVLLLFYQNNFISHCPKPLATLVGAAEEPSLPYQTLRARPSTL